MSREFSNTVNISAQLARIGVVTDEFESNIKDERIFFGNFKYLQLIKHRKSSNKVERMKSESCQRNTFDLDMLSKTRNINKKKEISTHTRKKRKDRKLKRQRQTLLVLLQL
jgi:hypothetical protein